LGGCVNGRRRRLIVGLALLGVVVLIGLGASSG
jgi:hypothetical protein